MYIITGRRKQMSFKEYINEYYEDDDDEIIDFKKKKKVIYMVVVNTNKLKDKEGNVWKEYPKNSVMIRSEKLKQAQAFMKNPNVVAGQGYNAYFDPSQVDLYEVTTETKYKKK